MEGHQRGTSSRTAHDPRRPSLERPSLFAGPDDDTADADGLRGVRILSTLESQERGRGAPSRRPASTRERTPGTPWLLWALVVMGLTSAGVALWWAHARWPGDNPTANALADTAAATVKPSTSAASAVAASAAGASSTGTAVSEAPAIGASAVAGTPLAALIENTPPAAGPSVLAIAPVGSTPAAATKAASNPAQGARTPEKAQKSRQTALAVQADKGEKSEKGDKPEKARKAKTPSKPTDTPPSSRRDRHAHADRDVELLEAVMSHTERRQRP